MFRPLALSIAFRYTRAKRANHFIAFIANVSMMGIGLGVLVLITVLSVMNGFEHEIRSHIFSVARQVTISTPRNNLPEWKAVRNRVRNIPGVLGIAPYVDGQGLLAASGTVATVLINGILPEAQNEVSPIGQKMHQGNLSNLAPDQFGIILGSSLAKNLGVAMGDSVTVVTPKASITPMGIIPRFKRFTVRGIFHMGGGLGYDAHIALLHLKDAQRLFGLERGNVSGLELSVDGLYAAPQVAHRLRQHNPGYWIQDWTERYSAYFKAIRMEKTMMFLILLLIIIIAAFNLVSSLVMVVTEKQTDIAILRTLGATQWDIVRIFMLQGLLVGTTGTLAGTVAGILLSLHITDIVNLMEHVLHTHFISSAFYFIDFVPARIAWMDVLSIAGMALLMSFLATCYPAWQAARVHPVKALRYE